MNIDLFTVFDKSDGFAAREIENEFIIVPLAPHKLGQEDALYLLNETGREIWEHLNGKTNLNQLIKMINKRYNTVIDGEIRKDVLVLVKELLNHKMIKKVKPEF